MMFKTKSGMFKHRKLKHPNQVPVCKRYQTGYCGFSDEFCWNKHNEHIDRHTEQIHEKVALMMSRIFTKAKKIWSPQKTVNKTQDLWKIWKKEKEKKLNRRGKRKSVYVVDKNVIFGGVNPDGARGKWGTIKKAVRESGASIWMMQETKCQIPGYLKLDGFITYEHTRSN